MGLETQKPDVTTDPEGGVSASSGEVSGEASVNALAALAEAGNPFAASELAQRLAEAGIRLEVAESERRHARQALEALPQAVLVTDPFDDIVLVSGAAGRLFGVAEGERPSGPVCELVRDAGLTQLIMRTRALHTRGASRRVRRAIHTASGRRVFDIHLLCVCDQDDGTPSPWGVVTILEEAHAVERQQSAELTVAHELRTPLCSIRAYTEMLMEGEAPDEATRQQFLGVIAAETERLTRLVENIQLVARIESGRVEMPTVEVNLGDLVRRACGSVAPQALASGVSLTFEPPAESPRVLGDADLLTQALINVVYNSIKYTPAGGWIRVSVESSRSWASVVVSDSGVGISEEDLPFVFDRFYRCDRHRRLATGSGMGLALVRQIVETVHGGTATVESKPGQGTKVRISLPREAAGVLRGERGVRRAG